MKITAILLLSACMTAAAKSSSQTVSMSVKDAPLEKVFSELHKQTGYAFFYDLKEVNKAKPVSLSVKNKTLEEVLNLCLTDQPLSYTIVGKTVVIKPSSTAVFQPAVSPILESAPPIDVKGRIVDEKGEPVVATVGVKGSSKAVSTNENGEFEIKGVDDNATLEVSGVSIETFEVKVSGRNELTLRAKMKVTSNEEITVNTGYQKLKPNEVVGSVNVITKDQLKRIVSTDIIGQLRDNIPGLLIKSGSINQKPPENSNDIVIRGFSTINSNKSPLLVLNDFPYEGNISDINPNDVESVTVLKDAAASSIWGSRAGNGVIVITTKKGKLNQAPAISVNSNISIFSKPDISENPILNSKYFIEVETFLFDKGYYNTAINSPDKQPLTPAIEILLKRKNGLISLADSINQLNALKQLDVRNDLLKYYFRNTIRHQHALDISGGGHNHLYFASVGYDYNLESFSNFRRLTVNGTNSYFFMKKKLEISSGIFYTNGLQTATKDAYEFTYPYAQIADQDGKPLSIARRRKGYIDTAGAGRLLDWNYFPLTEQDFVDRTSMVSHYRASIGVKYRIIRGLNIEMCYMNEGGYTNSRNHQSLGTYFTRDLINQFTKLGNAASQDLFRVPRGGILDIINNKYKSQNFRGQLSYNYSWKVRHQIIAIGGGEVERRDVDGIAYRFYGYDSQTGTSIPVDFVNTYSNYVTGIQNLIPNNQSFVGTADRYVSAFANASYIFKGTYSFSGSIRRDGANIFGTSTNNKWKPLWSAGFSWNIDKESFYNIRWLATLRLRSTYGYQGNVNNSVSGLLTELFINGVNRWNYSYAIIGNLPNPDLRWEKIGQANIGIDYGFVGNRITGSFDYYRKRGIDLIGDQQLPPSSGVSSIKSNSATMRGEGIDFTLNTKNTMGKIKWATTLNFSIAKDKVTEYNLPITTISSYIIGGNINPVVGRPVSSVYSYNWSGLDPASGDPQVYLNDTLSKNYNSIRSSTNLNNMVYNGPATPPYFGNILNTFTWKQLSVAIDINYRFGYYFRRSSINYFSFFSNLDRGNMDYERRWQKSGDEALTNVPSLVYPANSSRDEVYNFSDILVEKGDNIRLQYIRLDYDVTKQKWHKLPFQALKLFVYASNLGIIWRANHSGIDPEYNNVNYYTSGVPGKTISFGMNLKF